MHSTCGAIFFTGQAIPAFIKFHECLAGDVVNGKHIERAHIHAHGAAFFGNAFLGIHLDGDLGNCCGMVMFSTSRVVC